MFENILLEKDQEDLLIEIVEIVRSIPKNNRHKFIAAQSMSGTTLIFPGYPKFNKEVFIGDLETLASEGLLALTYSSRGTPNFNVNPLGFRYYEYIKERLGSSTERIENTMRNYLDGYEFQQKYPEAYKKWSSAEELLWQTDTEQQLTTIGHLCREAVQEFANTLVEQHKPSDTISDKKMTVARLQSILKKSSQLGSTEKPFLEALLAYWGTINDLIQRQEHGAQNERQVLLWEDARRVVFQTIVVMFEIDKSL